MGKIAHKDNSTRTLIKRQIDAIQSSDITNFLFTNLLKETDSGPDCRKFPFLSFEISLHVISEAFEELHFQKINMEAEISV